VSIPLCNAADLFNGPRIDYETRHWDAEGHERTERRNGAMQCPKCGLWWPMIEEPDMWDQNEKTGRWDASGWWGGVACCECRLLLIEQPDGTCEAYELPE